MRTSFPEAPVNCRWTMVSIWESFFKRACVFPDQIYRYPMLLQSSLIEEMSSLKCGPTPSINGTCNLKVVLCWVMFTMALKCQEMSPYLIVFRTFLRKLPFEIDWNGTIESLLACSKNTILDFRWCAYCFCKKCFRLWLRYKIWTQKNWIMTAETFMQKVFKFKKSTDDYSLVVDRRKI